MSRLKEKWNKIPTATKWYIGITLVAIVVVIWVCGINGNNADNFWMK